MLQHTGVPISVFAVCWGGAGTRAGLGARARAGTGAGRLFVLSRCRWTRARSGARLGARLWAGRGSGWGLAPSWRLLLGSPAGGSGSAPGAVAAPGATLWAGVAAGARAALAVTAGRERERARNYNNVSAFQNKILNLLTVCQTDLKPRKFLNNLWIQPKINKKTLLSAVLKHLQFATIQFCPIKLGYGILHVTAGCKLNHPAWKEKLVDKQFTLGIQKGSTQKTATHPSFLVGLWASTKVTSPAFLIRSFRSYF